MRVEEIDRFGQTGRAGVIDLLRARRPVLVNGKSQRRTPIDGAGFRAGVICSELRRTRANLVHRF